MRRREKQIVFLRRQIAEQRKWIERCESNGVSYVDGLTSYPGQGMDIRNAIAEAQSYTWESLNRARHTGRCQLTPNRLFNIDSAGPEGRWTD